MSQSEQANTNMLNSAALSLHIEKSIRPLNQMSVVIRKGIHVYLENLPAFKLYAVETLLTNFNSSGEKRNNNDLYPN